MLRPRNDGLRRTALVLIAAIGIGGCATGSRVPHATVESSAALPPGVISAADAERSRERIAIGRSTKADVAAALGRAAAILTFESGFEVWVYRVIPAQAAKQGESELVLLFAPSGALAKTRLRPPVVGG